MLKAEEAFTEYQTKRREQQESIQNIQSRLQEIRYDLDKTSRTDDRYLELITAEHNLIKKEKLLSEDFKIIERIERDNFGRLSTSLRESHEKERERAEKTKYWSIIGSMVGALIGILGTTVNNRMRFRELKNIVTESADPGRIQKVLNDLLWKFKNKQVHMKKNQKLLIALEFLNSENAIRSQMSKKIQFSC